MKEKTGIATPCGSERSGLDPVGIVIRCKGLQRVFLGLLLGVAFFTTGCYSLKTMGMRKEVVVMEATAYCACKKCCEWKRSWGCFLLPPVHATGRNKGRRKVVGITADGSKAKKGTIAADTRRYPFGTIMHVPGYGWGEVHDRGRAIKGNRIDVFFKSHKKALQFGRKKVKVKVYRR